MCLWRKNGVSSSFAPRTLSPQVSVGQLDQQAVLQREKVSVCFAVAATSGANRGGGGVCYIGVLELETATELAAATFSPRNDGTKTSQGLSSLRNSNF